MMDYWVFLAMVFERFDWGFGGGLIYSSDRWGFLMDVVVDRSVLIRFAWSVLIDIDRLIQWMDRSMLDQCGLIGQVCSVLMIGRSVLNSNQLWSILVDFVSIDWSFLQFCSIDRPVLINRFWWADRKVRRSSINRLVEPFLQGFAFALA